MIGFLYLFGHLFVDIESYFKLEVLFLTIFEQTFKQIKQSLKNIPLKIGASCARHNLLTQKILFEI